MKRVVLIAMMLCLGGLYAQAQNQITENPEGAVKLRRIWSLKGWGRVDSVVGRNAAGIGDINDDGFDDFSVSVGHEAWIFLGGNPPLRLPVYKIDSSVYSDTRSPIVGDFLGNGDTLIGFIHPDCVPHNPLACFLQVPFYREDDDSLLKRSEYMLDIRELNVGFAMHAADLDLDGDDELIAVNGAGGATRVRIYRGGADFTLAVPTMTMTTTTDRSLSSSVADFDGDQHIDLCIESRTPSSSQMMFWWGTEQGSWNWSDTPDRTLTRLSGQIAPIFSSAYRLVDYNGDRQHDFVGQNDGGTDYYLWLSDRGIDFRTRRYDSTDVELHIPRASAGGTYGFVADSLGRYMMMVVNPPWDEADDSSKGLGGGAEGPNMTFDAWFPGNEGPLLSSWDVGDVDGNGWMDALIYSGEYGGPGVGIALIIGGGPYIPSDDPTVDVREIATGEHVRAIHTWPNPVDDELHIAWREDISAKPARLTLHDVSGRLLLDERVRYWKGEQTISCAGVASGAYLLSFYDNAGTMIATTEVIKR